MPIIILIAVLRGRRVLLVLIFCALPAVAGAGTLYPEKVYNEAWCGYLKGTIEYRFDDGTRVDCLLDHYAVEVEFAHKYLNSTGQANHYARKSGKKSGILLILEKESDVKYWNILKADLERNVTHMRMWCIAPFPMVIQKTKCFRLLRRGRK